jgi:hypothetical protein
MGWVGTVVPARTEPSLINGDWRIVEIDGRVLDKPATLTFYRYRFVGLVTPCRTEWGWYSIDAQGGLSMRIVSPQRYAISSHEQRLTQCAGIDYQLVLMRTRQIEPEGRDRILRDGAARMIVRLTPAN